MSESWNIAQLYAFVFTALLAAAILWIAKKKSFFIIAKEEGGSPVTFKQTVGAFVSYLFLAFIFFPLLYFGVGRALTGSFASVKELPFVWKGWLQVIAQGVVFIWFFLYPFFIKKEAREYIFWRGQRGPLRENLKSAGFGAVGFAVSYPLMTIMSLLLGFLSYLIFKKHGVEQVAVQQLIMTLDYPLLFALMLVVVVVLIPYIEELLFRGFLQSWLKRYLSRKGAIVVTAFIFALVHFSYSQGLGNIELIGSLFVLSCFLGFVYERERRLIASIAMHSTFNAFSALMIFLSHTT